MRSSARLNDVIDLLSIEEKKSGPDMAITALFSDGDGDSDIVLFVRGQ